MRTNHRVIAFGEIKLLIEWIEDERCVVGYATLLQRLENGWEPEIAITTAPKRTLPTPPTVKWSWRPTPSMRESTILITDHDSIGFPADAQCYRCGEEWHWPPGEVNTLEAFCLDHAHD
jgi:hypothetical protein